MTKEKLSPKAVYSYGLVDNFMNKHNIYLDEDLKNLLGWRVFSKGVSLSPHNLERDIEHLLEQVRLDGNLPHYVNKYLEERGEVVVKGDLEFIKTEMVKYLRKMNVNIIGETEFDSQKYDEYFALAYEHALQQISGGDDPLTSVFSKTTHTDWDFKVDTFESIEEQGVVKENILAAGALYYVYELGERLGVYKLADALILRWAAGAIDIPKGETASKLYRFYKLREERNTPEERGMLYKRILDIGESKLLSNMVVNQDFPLLWQRLLTKTAEYIDKYEESSGDEEQVSKQPIFQTIKDLQFNLTSYMTGMAHLQVTESYHHLRDAFDILGDTQIVDHFSGGPRKNMWTVIERIAREEFNRNPNISNIRTAAVEGNKIFQHIAEFNEGGFSEEQFRQFLRSCEKYIIAQAEEQQAFEQPEEEWEDIEEDIEEFDDFEDF